MDTRRLDYVYEGWDGYHRSIVNAVRDLTPGQLAFKAPNSSMQSVGDLVWHIADGRVEWFVRLGAPLSAELMAELEGRQSTPDDAETIVGWLERTWKMVAATLDQLTVDDLPATYEQPYQGKVYAVPRQRVNWR